MVCITHWSLVMMDLFKCLDWDVLASLAVVQQISAISNVLGPIKIHGFSQRQIEVSYHFLVLESILSFCFELQDLTFFL